jgi:hypothetical protein
MNRGKMRQVCENLLDLIWPIKASSIFNVLLPNGYRGIEDLNVKRLSVTPQMNNDAFYEVV